MRELVQCQNCGLVWMRVTMFGSDLELTEDLQYFCPACRSNAYEYVEKKNEAHKAEASLN